MAACRRVARTRSTRLIWSTEAMTSSLVLGDKLNDSAADDACSQDTFSVESVHRGIPGSKGQLPCSREPARRTLHTHGDSCGHLAARLGRGLRIVAPVEAHGTTAPGLCPAPRNLG